MRLFLIVCIMLLSNVAVAQDLGRYTEAPSQFGIAPPMPAPVIAPTFDLRTFEATQPVVSGVSGVTVKPPLKAFEVQPPAPRSGPDPVTGVRSPVELQFLKLYPGLDPRIFLPPPGVPASSAPKK